MVGKTDKHEKNIKILTNITDNTTYIIETYFQRWEIETIFKTMIRSILHLNRRPD